MPEKYKVKNRKLLHKNIARVFDSLDFYKAIRAHGDKVVLRYFRDGKIADMTYNEFCDNVVKLAAAFTGYGLKGKRIVLIGETSPEWLESYVASMVSGCIVVPMDKELAQSEIENFCHRVSANAIVYSKTFNKKFGDRVKAFKTVKYMIPISPDDSLQSGKLIPFADVLAHGEKEIAEGYALPEKVDRSCLCEMLFTSGTTGTSKCVMLSQRNVYSVVACAARQTEFTADDVILSVLPVHHTYELACIQAAMVLGMTVCINDTLRHFMRNIATFKPTGLVLVPMFITTIYKKIMSEAEKNGKTGKMKTGLAISKRLSYLGIDARRKIFKSVVDALGGRIEKIICGGARLDPSYVQAFDDFGITVCEGYGITECSPLAAVTPYFARVPGSVGPAVTCCSARIKPNGAKSDDGKYDLGEIQIKGENVMLGYYRDPEANAEAFTADGWFRTGDVGYIDENGYIYITGRMKFVIVLDNGKNVFPEEIEEYLNDLDKISECIVVGRPGEEGDTVLTALVYPDFTKVDADLDDEEIAELIKNDINVLNRDLPSFKQVRNVEIRREEFEKTTTKKIKRHLVQ